MYRCCWYLVVLKSRTRTRGNVNERNVNEILAARVYLKYVDVTTNERSIRMCLAPVVVHNRVEDGDSY